MMDHFNSYTIADLLIPGTCSQDLELVEDYFCERDAFEIARIPIALATSSDYMVFYK